MTDNQAGQKEQYRQAVLGTQAKSQSSKRQPMAKRTLLPTTP
jgi:hypothetical protein